MAPTINSDKELKDPKKNTDIDRDKRAETLICRVRYNNTLPDIPFDPKFLQYPFESNRFIQYNATSLERNYKHELLTEHDAGINIDLVNPDLFKIDHRAKLHPTDERLLEDDAPTSADSKRSRQHQKTVSWLKKTEYISTELYNKSTNQSEKAESRIGFNIRKMLKEEDVYRDRQSQIDAIEATFSHAREPITKHYSKPGVTPVEILPVFPDFDTWQHPCAQVIFDADPTPTEKGNLDRREDINQAMIRGMVDETGDQFVAYFLPTEETKRKRKRDIENSIPYQADDVYEYDLTREYNWNVKNKSMSNYEENYFFVFRNEGVFYNELETRVRLSKRRKLGTTGGAPSTKTRLLVQHRDFTDDELKSQAARLAMLDPDIEEEEEEEDDDEEEAENEEEEENENLHDEEEEEKENEQKDSDDEDDDDDDEEGSPDRDDDSEKSD